MLLKTFIKEFTYSSDDIYDIISIKEIEIQDEEILIVDKANNEISTRPPKNMVRADYYVTLKTKGFVIPLTMAYGESIRLGFYLDEERVPVGPKDFGYNIVIFTNKLNLNNRLEIDCKLYNLKSIKFKFIYNGKTYIVEDKLSNLKTITESLDNKYGEF